MSYVGPVAVIEVGAVPYVAFDCPKCGKRSCGSIPENADAFRIRSVTRERRRGREIIDVAIAIALPSLVRCAECRAEFTPRCSRAGPSAG